MTLDFYSLGEELYIKENYLEAYNAFQKGYQLGIDTNDCLNYMGCCQMELGNLFEALKIFDRLIEKTTWERPLFNKGSVYLKMGELDKALAYFKKAERVNPENPDVYYYLGVFYEKIKDYGNAQKYYQQSLELDPDQPETQLNLGVMCLRLGQLDKAMEMLNLSKKDEFTKAYSYANMGYLLYKKQQYDLSLEDLFTALKLLPRDTEVMNEIANCYYHLRNYPDCLQWLDKVLQIDPTDEEALEHKKIILKISTRGEDD